VEVETKPIRKSKRERKNVPIVVEKVSKKEELQYLQANWDIIAALYCESLYFGTYTSMGEKKLLEGTRKTKAMLKQWRLLMARHPSGHELKVSLSVSKKYNVKWVEKIPRLIAGQSLATDNWYSR